MYEEVLVPKAKNLIAPLTRFKKFYLVGDTALALQVGHRVSVDFDMFTKDALPVRLFHDVKRIFNGYSIKVTYRSPQQLNLLVDDIKMTFFLFLIRV